MPFVQGQLRGEYLSFVIETECAHCHRLIHIEIDSDLKYKVIQPASEPPDAEPLIFSPMVDFKELKDPSITDAF